MPPPRPLQVFIHPVRGAIGSSAADQQTCSTQFLRAPRPRGGLHRRLVMRAPHVATDSIAAHSHAARGPTGCNAEGFCRAGCLPPLNPIQHPPSRSSVPHRELGRNSLSRCRPHAAGQTISVYSSCSSGSHAAPRRRLLRRRPLCAIWTMSARPDT
eukprot:1941343-Pyramimonas_sp.AAC.1